MNYTHLDIKWIKSITRERGNNWAYMDFELGDTFYLNFSKNNKWYPTNYEKVKPGELLVLFQTLKSSNDFLGGSYLTHVVTPLDNEINKIEDESLQHPYTRLVAVVGVMPQKNPVSKDWSFFKSNRGQICNIDTIENKKASKTLLQKQEFLFNSFKFSFDSLEVIKHGFISDLEFEEGKESTVFKLHKYKERSPELVSLAKSLAIKENRLYCEICNFNFEKKYPILGNGFIECHHKLPISSGGIRKTRVEDLCLVCSNCHRMLHRKTKEGVFLTVEELKKLIFAK